LRDLGAVEQRLCEIEPEFDVLAELREGLARRGVVALADLSRPEVGEILTADQLAHRWQIKVAWIYAKTRSGDIPKVPLPGRYYRYRLDTIEAYERGELDSDERAA